MNWIESKVCEPKKDGYYKTINYIGKEECHFFKNGIWESETPILKWLDESESEKHQLKLQHDTLISIGFDKKTTVADEDNPSRDFYEIPCVNGFFYYNPNEEQYKWYQKVVIGDYSNHILLNIEELEELYIILQCFRVNFNLIIY